ncbi:MAG: hypothetical protein HYU75_23665 [Betaproteobacteria bacterium]|nr:hypothetical protein [Betaproteobacteria bacterium]
MRVGKRERVLLAVLFAALVAALWPLPESDAPQGVAERKPPLRARDAGRGQPQAPALGPLGAPAPVQQRAIADLFPRQSWLPPPSAPAAQKPSAPPLPFSYGGRYTEGDKVFIFLNEGTQVHTARQGETVKGSYRIDRIGDAEITFTYLPLGEQQSLPTGSMTPRQ